MNEGQLGIFPEEKINRTTQEIYSLIQHNQIESLETQTLKQRPFKLHGHIIKQTRVMKIVGSWITQDGKDYYQKQMMLKEATKAWAGITHQIT